MRVPRAASTPRHVVTISFCIVLTLIPVVCNAGGLAPRHAAEMMTPAHPAGHSAVGHGAPAARHFAQPMPSCSPLHGHACCLLAARKPLREDLLDGHLAVVPDATSQGAIATLVRRGSVAAAPEPIAPPALAAINVPLLR